MALHLYQPGRRGHDGQDASRRLSAKLYGRCGRTPPLRLLGRLIAGPSRRTFRLQVEAFYPEPLNAWFEVRCYPSPEGLSMFFTDTTERKQREEQLRLLESAALQTSDGILILKVPRKELRRGKNPIFVNPAFERITGFDLDDLRQGALEAL